MAQGMLGANPEELRALGGRYLARQADVGTAKSTTAAEVEGLEWTGADADRFRARYQNAVVAAFAKLGELLAEGAEDLDVQAQEQDETSAPRGSGAGPSGAPVFNAGLFFGPGGGGAPMSPMPQNPPADPMKNPDVPGEMDEASDFAYDKLSEWTKSEDFQTIYTVAQRNPGLFSEVLNTAIGARSGNPGDIAKMALYAFIAPDMCAAGYKLYDNIKTGAQWDLKPYLADKYDRPADNGYFYLTDDQGNRTRSDAYGNAVYGMMLAHLGVDVDTALRGANAGGEAGRGNDPLDDRSVRTGYEIYDRHRGGMDAGQFQQEIDDADLDH